MRYAEYTTFSVGDEGSGYRLLVSNYSGNAGRLWLKYYVQNKLSNLVSLVINITKTKHLYIFKERRDICIQKSYIRHFHGTYDCFLFLNMYRCCSYSFEFMYITFQLPAKLMTLDTHNDDVVKPNYHWFGHSKISIWFMNNSSEMTN